jgi:hypothetical protein
MCIRDSYSCYPDEASSLSDLDVVITDYDSSFLFSSVQTYMMPDTVIAITDPNDLNNKANHKYDQLILSQVAQQLNSLGYTRIYDTLTARPDVTVLLNTVATTYYGTYWYDWYDYWGWYGYWPPYWDGGYYYPWGTVTYNYTVGTLLMQMVDSRDQTPTADSLRVVWLGAINGVSSSTDATNRITRDIKQAFKQSPYL